MLTSKLNSLCKIAVLMLCLGLSSAVSAGYYIEYQNPPCRDYDACYAPPHHVRHHYYRHHRYYHPHRYYHHRRSSASMTVTYYWSIYPNYGCGGGCCGGCSSCGCRQGCAERVTYYNSGREYYPQYRDNEYTSRYHSRCSDPDYDTSTADDVEY